MPKKLFKLMPISLSLALSAGATDFSPPAELALTQTHSSSCRRESGSLPRGVKGALGTRVSADEKAFEGLPPVLKGITGPKEPSILKPPQVAQWKDFEAGSVSRMAILLTDPDSAWLGLVHGLHSIGLPFRITRDYREALRHRVVLVYPTISGRVLSAEALQALYKFPSLGGTLIGTNVEGGGLQEIFGFTSVDSGKTRHLIHLVKNQPLANLFTDERERTFPFSNPKAGPEAMGSDGYLGVRDAIARFDDGTAAITSKAMGSGHAYAFGVDLGFFFLVGYNNREQGVSRSFVNSYEPAIDVLLRLLKEIYRQSEPMAVMLYPVPQGKRMATILTHDVDWGDSFKNAIKYAELERSSGIRGTYFIQTKYIKDWNDAAFFENDAINCVRQLEKMGMEIGSHSVAHAEAFNKMILGQGDERFPDYQPFVKEKWVTVNATVFGELRISKFLLEHFLNHYQVVSFRPGHLKNPYTLPQALEASGYRYTSTATANSSMTHLPFRLTYGRETTSQSKIYEIPLSIEDEHMPRLDQVLALADRISQYGGSLVVLIHPNVTDHKLQFEKDLIQAVRPFSWFGTLREYGDFLTARDEVTVDVAQQGTNLQVSLIAGQKIRGLSLQIPAGYRVTSTEPKDLKFSQEKDFMVLEELKGDAKLILSQVGQ